VNDLSSEREVNEDQPDASHVSHSQKDYEPSINTESSFFPGQDAFSSTPATARVASTQQSFASQGSSNSSWVNPLESPLVRLSREIQSLDDDDDKSLAPPSIINMTPAGQAPNSTSEISQRQLDTVSQSTKGKAKESSQPLLRNVLRHNLYSASDASSSDFTSHKPVSPLKFRTKPKTPVPKTLNPYLPPNTDPDKWNGVVDLRDPTVLTPQRHAPGRAYSKHKAAKESDDDDSLDGLPEGMSPPVLMSPARPPRSSAELGLLKIGQTPTKEASARIVRDLVKDAQIRSGQMRHLYGYPNSGVESSMSTVPTPPSLSRYNRESSTSVSLADSSFDSMIRRVGLNVPSSSRLGSTPGLRLKTKAPLDQQRDESLQRDDSMLTPLDRGVLSTSVYDQLHHDIDSDSDSLDEINNTAHPSAAFLMASQGRRGGDDSFGSSNHSSDSLTDEDVDPGLVPVHPFAGGMEDDGFDDDDSFDGFDGNAGGGDFVEETVFGVAPAQRIAAQAAAAAQRQQGGLRMLGEDLLQDTLNIGARVEESPTPAWAGGYRA
jgi:DASH complex subunit ASK1